MKAFLNRLNTHPGREKVFHWGKLITITGGAQAIVQGTGLLCGILVIRLLPVNEYAYYTLANTMLGTMSVLADGGISTGVMAEGGKIWMDKEKLGAVLATGLSLRKKFGIISLAIAIPVLIYLTLRLGASWLTVLLIIASLIPALFAALSDSLMEIVPKLHQDITSLQKNQILVSTGRLILSALAVFVFPFTFVAILAAGIPRVYGNIGLYKITKTYASALQKPDPEIQKNILKIVKRILPGSIYYCLSGQITVWLISVLGTISSVAQAGALARLTTVLTLITVLFGTLIIPRFARLPSFKTLIWKRYVQIISSALLLGGFIILISYLYSGPILWILGPAYANLKKEFLLCITGSYIGLMAGLIFSLNTSRGWAIHPLINIPVNLLIICAGILFLNISTLKGLFIFNILLMSTEVIIFFIYGCIKIAFINKLPVAPEKIENTGLS